MRKTLLVAAVLAVSLLPIEPAAAIGPVKCYTRNDYGVLFTGCNDGYYAYTYRQGYHKISVWQNQDRPFYKVTCQALNDRSLLPVPRCKGPQIGLHSK